MQSAFLYFLGSSLLKVGKYIKQKGDNSRQKENYIF